MSRRPNVHNWEIVLLAVHLEGGVSKRVHTEDVTLRCFQLAPDTFSWLKHSQYPDKEVVRKDLTRLRDGAFGDNYVIGRAGITRLADDGEATTDGWQLTEKGVEWIAANESRLDSLLRTRTAKATRQEAMKALDRVRNHNLFAEFEQIGSKFVPRLGDLAELLRCRVDAEDRVWTSRFTALRNQALLAHENSILSFLERCETVRPNLRN